MSAMEGPPPIPGRATRTLCVARRELLGYFATPLAPVFLVMFVALSALLAFQAGGLYARGTADLRSLFQWQPWLALFFMPALGMRLWSDERRSGSLELLVTLPLATGDLVVGKFLAAWAFSSIALFLTTPLWITISWLGAPDHGVIVASYIATALLFGTMLSVCACLSACTRNAVVAFVLGVAACFILLMTGYSVVLDFFARWTPAWGIEAIAAMSALSHYEALVRGVIDARDLLYSLSVVCGMLWINAILLHWRATR
jgi:ABC-2 type transport system permease protein